MFEWFFEALKTIKRGIMSFGRWIREKFNKHRKKIIGFLIVLGSLMLLAGLITGSYKFVDSVSQGVPVNYSSGNLHDVRTANYGSFMGLNTYYQTVPNTFFAVSFDSQAPADSNTYPSLKARVKQGIIIDVQVYARVKIQPLNLKIFLQEYGFSDQQGQRDGWQLYISEKIRNVVVQEIAKHKLYALSNQIVTTAVNRLFSNYRTFFGFPFDVKIVGLNMHYPQDTLRGNSTLGVKLLETSSLLSQLKIQKTQLENNIGKYFASATQYASKGGQLQGKIRNGELAVKLGSPQWSQGVQIFDSMVQNSTLLQKYLQIYFNSIYNVTYRLDSLKPFQI